MKRSQKASRLLRFFLLALVVCTTASCAHYPKNAAMERYDPRGGYRYPLPEETAGQDSLFVALAFSGGGTRSAALSYGVLKKLAQIPIPGGSQQTMLDQVDVISSVSGGSFTAAYYGLFKERIFKDFEEGFLYRDVQSELVHQLFNPANALRLMSPYYSRIDMAAELYGKTLFESLTFQEMVNRGRRPFIAMNATNMSTGERFTFTQEDFDLLGSSLSSYPVARAVAASSAFPFLLSPITLVNHEAPRGFELPEEIERGLKDADVNERRYLWSRNRAVYHQDKPEHPYLHLMDGGLADNLGLRFITDGYRRTSGFLARRKTRIHQLVIIVVNAKTQPPEGLDMRESAPGLKDVALKTATVSMDNYSFETVQMTRDLLTESYKAAQDLEACQKLIDRYCGEGHQLPALGFAFRPYVIEINFYHVKDPRHREKLLALPTTFHLEREEVRDLIDVGGKLLEESPVFQELLRDLAQERQDKTAGG